MMEIPFLALELLLNHIPHNKCNPCEMDSECYGAHTQERAPCFRPKGKAKSEVADRRFSTSCQSQLSDQSNCCTVAEPPKKWAVRHVYGLAQLDLSGIHVCTTRCNALKLCILPTECICVFRMALTVNSGCGLCCGGVMCFL
jgi:hypothetical protein